MGMAQRTYGGIPDRKIRPIVTDYENGQYRNAMKQIVQLEPKFAKSAYVPALKALVGEKMGKHEEALQWCLEAREKLLKDLPALTDDKMLSAVHAVCQKLGRMDIAISCYEYATDTVPSSLDMLYGLFNCYIRVSAFLKQQQTALKMYKLSGEEMYLMWALCSMQLQVLHGTNGANLFPLAEGLIKKHLVAHSLLEPEALLVHISVLEQQGKYDTAREVLLESGPNLLVIEVDRLRIEGRLLARACDYAAAAEVFMRILQLCNDDWECFLDYLGCLLEDDSRWCSLTTSGPQTFPPRIVACKLDHLSDEEFDTRIAQASGFIQNLPAVTESMNVRGPYWAKIEIERRKRLRGKDNEMKEAIYDYFNRFSHLHSFVFDIEMFLQDFSKDEMFELHNNLLTKTTKEESVAAFNKMVTISGVREWFGLMFKQPLQDTEKVNVHRGDLYREMLKLSKNLDPQEAVQGQELLCMACNVLVQLFWRTRQLGYLVEAIVVLEFGLNIRRNYWQYKTLLVHLYSYFGVLPLAYEWYKTLDIKNILLETVWHHIVPQMLLSTHWADLAEILHGYISFMEDHFKESPDFIFLAYRHRNYTKAVEFVQFRERLERSHQYLMSKVESSVLKIKQTADNIDEVQSVLESSNCGIELLELCEERCKSLTFNDDTQSRPWWTPTPDCNYLLGEFNEDAVAGIRETKWQHYSDKPDREKNWRKIVERRSLLPRLIYLSIQCASLLKEYGKATDSPSDSSQLQSQTAAQSEIFALIVRFAESLDLSFDVASSMIAEISSGQRSVGDIPVHIMSLMTFGVFVASWRLSLNDAGALEMVDTLIEKYTQEKLSDMPQPLLSSPENCLSFLVQIVTEPIAWKSLVIQSCTRVGPKSSGAGASSSSGRRRNKRSEHPVVKLTPEMTQSISSSIQSSCGIVEGIIAVIKRELDISEDDKLEILLTPLQRKPEGVREGPGHFIQTLQDIVPSSADLGSKISKSLESWNPTDVPRKIVNAQRKTLLESLNVCESKLRLLESLKQQLLQLSS
ncbi:N-terminal acetyltransferase B complex auxiliary subunit NAA25-like isoform X1 [Papaver somniferum]|uniref:N-terminal acetyltransferase B complex auxiliary subunit NAA25-like isoform X1 n=1 Tax=Papaver somniferum TaxID=3469 RepID=UPI000E7018F0|nr:N-terminal acetyltransferase B complex auxiliary subunit NAA25-like isoform X1 [Papaver somniferum]